MQTLNTLSREGYVQMTKQNEKIACQSEKSENYLNLNEYILFQDIL